MPLVSSLLEGGLQSIFARDNNSPDFAAQKMAKVIDTYFRGSMPIIGGAVTVSGMESILAAKLLNLFSTPNMEAGKAAEVISSAIGVGVKTLVYVGPCFGTGQVTMYQDSMLKGMLEGILSKQYQDPSIPAKLIANGIHAVSLTAVATGSGVPPHCPGTKMCTIV